MGELDDYRHHLEHRIVAEGIRFESGKVAVMRRQGGSLVQAVTYASPEEALEFYRTQWEDTRIIWADY